MAQETNGIPDRTAVTITASTYTIQQNTHQVTYNGTVNGTFTMYQGDELRQIVGIKNASSKRLTVNFSGGQQVYDRGADTTMIISAGDGCFLQWDGTYWSVVGYFSAKYYTRDITATANQNFTLFGQNAILDIFCKSNNANNVTINIGTTANGTDLVNGLVITGNSFVRVPFTGGVYGANQILYISSASWNSANLDLSFDCRKV